MEPNPGQQQRLQALLAEKAPPPNHVSARLIKQALQLGKDTQELAQRRDALEQELQAITAELQRRTGEARRLSSLILEFDVSTEALLNDGLATPSPARDDDQEPSDPNKET